MRLNYKENNGRKSEVSNGDGEIIKGIFHTRFKLLTAQLELLRNGIWLLEPPSQSIFPEKRLDEPNPVNTRASLAAFCLDFMRKKCFNLVEKLLHIFLFYEEKNLHCINAESCDPPAPSERGV